MVAIPADPLTLIERDDFMHRMRLATGLTCVVAGLFRPGAGRLEALRMATAPGTSASSADEVCRHAMAAVATHLKAQEGLTLAKARPDPSAPVWLKTGPTLVGLGAPVLGRWPVLACPLPETACRADLEPVLGLGLVYLAQFYPVASDLAPFNPEAAAAATLRRLSIGCIILDAQGRVVHDGLGAEADRAGPLRVRHGKLSLANEADRTALRRAVTEAVSERQRLSLVPLTNDAGLVSLVAVTPLSQPGGARMALILFDTRQTDHGALRAHFFKAHALTRSESLIAGEVLDGKTPSEMAEATGLSLATVRSYLKQIMAKTGTHRQSELIALYYSCIIPVAPAFAAEVPQGRPSI